MLSNFFCHLFCKRGLNFLCNYRNFREYPYNQLCLNKKKREYAKINNELCNCY